MTKIKKVLIANRGEIAVRVMRTCQELDIKTVAVYSDADRNALHVQTADEAYHIGPSPSMESYLVIEKIISVAKKSGADAIHPGYGFLSEKEAFSKACADAGIIFLGPKAESIAAMGDKVTARNCAAKAKVPMVPGMLEPVDDLEKIKKLAKEFGYPVLLKAAAGGGGKGMRVVEKEADVESAFAMATSEATRAFGDGRVYLEKYIRNPRHVEIQIICDQHGNGLFLFERECSMQRRHQKIIEEAPCSYLRDDVRIKMAESSLRLAKAVGYHGVGTLEYLVDQEQNFYFLEMNTRLQVEHTVSEMITGLDFVRLQILVGEGETLPLKQDDITRRGHAIEARIYAEDPENGFMPSPGRIQWMRIPDGHGIRHDSGVYEGWTIPIYYDPMIAKLIVHAETRELAIKKMQRALSEYEIGGPKNNIGFLKTLMANDVFKAAQMHTQFLDQNPQLTQTQKPKLPIELIVGIAALDLMGADKKPVAAASQEGSNWLRSGLANSLNQRL